MCTRASAFFSSSPFPITNETKKIEIERTVGRSMKARWRYAFCSLRLENQIVSLGIIPTEANKTAERRGGCSYVDELRIYLAYLLNEASHPDKERTPHPYQYRESLERRWNATPSNRSRTNSSLPWFSSLSPLGIAPALRLLSISIKRPLFFCHWDRVLLTGNRIEEQRYLLARIFITNFNLL